jgi:hypothetical protein
MSQEFVLQPFEPVAYDWQITGSYHYRDHQLLLKYLVTGDLSQLVIPEQQSNIQRVTGLWEATCCEFFLAPAQCSEYWEFNMSPNGNWQVFKLDSYRQGLREEAAVESLPTTVAVIEREMSLTVSIYLSVLMPPETAWEISVTAVMQDLNKDYSYWAINHAGVEADFHLRQSFQALYPN